MRAAIARAWFGQTWQISNPTMVLCLAGIILPNALSLGAMAFDVGMPPRTGPIIAYASLALIAGSVSPFIFVPAYLCIVAYDALETISASFNLMPHEIGLALNLGAQLDLYRSPIYIVMIAALIAVVAANIAFLVRKKNVLRLGNTFAAISFAFVFAGADYLANASPHYHFGTLQGSGKEMESAAVDSGFRETLLTQSPRNALLVIIEAMGLLDDDAKQDIVVAAFHNPALLARYDVRFGATTFYGSTTAAEMRELCDSRASFQEMKAPNDIVCLPKILGERGYRTTSLHNFTSIFFDRPEWYPNVGLERSMFAEDLASLDLRQCGVAFRGACDVELLPLVTKHLRDTSKPNFFYWLTLSTHAPIAPREATPRLDCEDDGGPIGHVEVCYMAEMWIDLFEGLVRMTADVPPTEILIVGDHAPPLWSKAGRGQFTPGKVPWIRLTPRAALDVSAAR